MNTDKHFERQIERSSTRIANDTLNTHCTPIDLSVQNYTMEQEDDRADQIFDEMTMSDSAQRRKFLEACRKSFDEQGAQQTDSRSENFDHGKAFEDWKFFVSLMLWMGLVDVNNENLCQELNEKNAHYQRRLGKRLELSNRLGIHYR